MGGRPPRILVTRPREDAKRLTEDLIRRGAEVLIKPMFEIILLKDTSLDLRGVKGLLFTSANGVRAFAKASERRDLRVFSIGVSTASTARAYGFTYVDTAGGNVRDLVALSKNKWRPNSGKLIHAAGHVVSGQLTGELTDSGYEVRKITLYEARAADTLGNQLSKVMCEGALNYALFFSPRTASTFVSLVTDAGFRDACEHVEAICLSSAVAEALELVRWRRITVAAEPDQNSLLVALDGRLARKDT